MKLKLALEVFWGCCLSGLHTLLLLRRLRMLPFECRKGATANGTLDSEEPDSVLSLIDDPDVWLPDT